ncbi:MAG: type I-E CRISPR-associated protein Cas6/Cse3/CasE [Porticoccaceae bacterium]
MSLIAGVLHLDRRAVKALRITDPYSLHRVIYSLYPDVRSEADKSQSQASGILYADQGGDHQSRKILMLADRAPAPRVEDQYGEVHCKPLPEGFLDHAQYRFKVIVNPTRRDSASRKLIAVRGREVVADWFAERAESSWGFAVDHKQLQVDRIEVLQFKDKQQRSVTIGQAHIQGLLHVRAPQQFKTSFTQGIGRARAFGCGLLQIVPIIDNLFT